MTTDAGGADRKTRKERPEIARNRALILDTVEKMFPTHGLDISMNAVAKEAGLGPATVYRRFSGPDEIIRALYDRAFERFKDITENAAAQPDGWSGVVAFLKGCVLVNNRHPVIAAVAHRMGRIDPEYRPSDVLVPILEDIVERAKAEGKLRSDVWSVDLAVVSVALGALTTLPEPVRSHTTARQLHLILAGLSTEAEERGALPVGEALRMDGLHDLAHHLTGAPDVS